MYTASNLQLMQMLCIVHIYKFKSLTYIALEDITRNTHGNHHTMYAAGVFERRSTYQMPLRRRHDGLTAADRRL